MLDLCPTCGQPIPDSEPDAITRIAEVVARRLLGEPDWSMSWSDLRRSVSARDREKLGPATKLLVDRRYASFGLTPSGRGTSFGLTTRGAVAVPARKWL